MKKLVMLALFGAAIWVAWKQWPTLFDRRPMHEVVVVNETPYTIERLRVSIGTRTFVEDTLKAGKTFQFPCASNGDSDIRMVWEWTNKIGEAHWWGGRIASGPDVLRHKIRIDPARGVVYVAEPKTGL